MLLLKPSAGTNWTRWFSARRACSPTEHLHGPLMISPLLSDNTVCGHALVLSLWSRAGTSSTGGCRATRPPSRHRKCTPYEPRSLGIHQCHMCGGYAPGMDLLWILLFSIGALVIIFFPRLGKS